MSEGYPSVTSEKHMTRGLVWVSLDVDDELHDGTLILAIYYSPE
jgi:hypothetical protein